MAQKAFGLAVPVYFKFAIDHSKATQLPVGPEALQAANIAAMMLCFSGLFKAMGIATELQMVSFTPVAQAAGRSRVGCLIVLNLTCSFTYREGRCVARIMIEAQNRCHGI